MMIIISFRKYISDGKFGSELNLQKRSLLEKKRH